MSLKYFSVTFISFFSPFLKIFMLCLFLSTVSSRGQTLLPTKWTANGRNIASSQINSPFVIWYCFVQHQTNSPNLENETATGLVLGNQVDACLASIAHVSQPKLLRSDRDNSSTFSFHQTHVCSIVSVDSMGDTATTCYHSVANSPGYYVKSLLKGFWSVS